jgi:tRNA pseudouridine55 synthase
MDGILNINKPGGMTSFGVVARVKRITGEKHIGHAGTLDPLATGVLPVCLGQATRVIEYLFDETKTYLTEVELGVSTDTYDSTGTITRNAEVAYVSRPMIESALAAFRGAIRQTPPMFSALKHQGKPLYRLARAGILVERPSRPAQIHTLEIVEWKSPLITLKIVCGKGTYIRSIAHDLGEALGCGASMKSLIRRQVGPFRLEDAVTLEEIGEAFRAGLREGPLYPIDYVLQSFNAVVVDDQQGSSLVHGNPVTFAAGQALDPDNPANPVSRAYTPSGDLLGMIRYDSESRCWHPEKIFIKAAALKSEKE